MPLLLDAGNHILEENYNPAIFLTENLKGHEIEFPDPNTYFILSDIGKSYSEIGNETILLNPDRGYFEPIFTLDFKRRNIVNSSQELFKGSKALEGDAKRALELAIKKTAKTKTSLNNRF